MSADDCKPFCTCYPRGFTPAEPWLQRCSGEAHCLTRAESRLISTPEGLAQHKARYAEWATQRASGDASNFDVVHNLSRLGVPGVSLSAAKAPSDTDAIQAARQWTKDDARLVPALVLVGDKGTGKSVAAAWATLQWARKFPWNDRASGTQTEPMVWLDTAGLRRLGDFGPEAARLVDAVATARWVVFDDAGREGSPRAMEAVSDALMERCDKSRRFVLTTNLTKDAFKARYGEPLTDRLRSSGLIVALKGQSMRQPFRRSA